MNKKKKKYKGWQAPRYLFFLFLFFFVILYGKFLYISLSPVINGINIQEFAANRNTVSTTLYAKRGSFYDTEGNILATNVSSYTVIAYLDENRTVNPKNPLHVVDKEKTAEALAPIINMSKETILELLNKKNSSGKTVYQVELGPGGRGITELVKEEIQALKLPGIDFIETYKRFYPNGDFASYIIGYAKQYEEVIEVDSVKKIEYSIVGELGLELQYEKILQGTNGYLQYQKDRQGYKIPDTDETRIDAEDGYDVYLTLNSNVQRFVEAAVKDVARDFSPKWMTLTIMDAKTGAILGTSSSPSFDPNIRNISDYYNPLISKTYEPGSTMKIYTYMCAIESGKYKNADTVQSGSLKIGDDTINDWNNGQGWGLISYDLGFEYSSNVAAARLTQTVINRADLTECLDKYGFGHQTGIELPREYTGTVDFTYPIEVATAAFGQGRVTTTAIQQLQALTIIANDGKMLKPYIVKKVVDPNTKQVVLENTKIESEQLVKTSTVNKMRDLMYYVIHGKNPGTTGGSYYIPGFDLIGKTGTAQIVDPATKKYMVGDNAYVYSFAGMFPKDDPQIIIYAAYQQPTWGTSYGLSLAVKEVLQNSAKYLNVFSEDKKTEAANTIVIKSYINKNIETIKSELSTLKIIALGDGQKVIDQYPKSGTKLVSGNNIILKTNAKEYKMPNLTNLSRTETIAILDLLGVKYNIEGYGKVVSQSIPTDTVLVGNETINITLQ